MGAREGERERAGDRVGVGSAGPMAVAVAIPVGAVALEAGIARLVGDRRVRVAVAILPLAAAMLTVLLRLLVAVALVIVTLA